MKRYDSLRSGKRSRVLDRQRKKEKADIRNSRSFGYGYAVLTGVAVVAILILAFALFFKVDQIRAIYTGAVRLWCDVGSDLAVGIEAYQRPHGSGSQTAMEEMVMDGLQLAAAEEN